MNYAIHWYKSKMFFIHLPQFELPYHPALHSYLLQQVEKEILNCQLLMSQ